MKLDNIHDSLDKKTLKILVKSPCMNRIFY